MGIAGHSAQRRLRRLLLCLAVCAATTLSPSFVTAKGEKISDAHRAARSALESGSLEQARFLLSQALSQQPSSAAILGDLLRAHPDDAEMQALWLHHAVGSLAGASGRFSTPSGWPKVARDDLQSALALAKERAGALKTTLGQAKSVKGALGGSQWRTLRVAARELSFGNPAMEAATERTFGDKSAKRVAPDAEGVVQALGKLLASLPKKDAAGRLAVGRVLLGLAGQRSEEPAAGADITGAAPRVAAAVREAREALDEAGLRVYTVEELTKVPVKERGAWSRAHATWSNPGVAVSPQGLYRIETTSGLEALLIATRDIEKQHRRLAAWFGQDPFEKRQGLVRLCPTHADMEAEGSPFWWAGGWQSGDLTGLSIRWGNSYGLASMLTHELTHRFDGAIYPGLPTWLLEGRAVYTEICSPHPDAKAVVEVLYHAGRLYKSYYEGYGAQHRLEALIDGEIEEYRDNYFAGYSLWLFLERHRGFGEQSAPLVFEPRIQDYLESFRRKKSRGVQHFVKFFADGRDGRPKGLEAFTALFEQFLREGKEGGNDAVPWVKEWLATHYETRRGMKGPAWEAVYDAEARAHTRNRHDPLAYGETHAWEGGLLLEAHGKRDAALRAFEWALAVDDPLPAHLLHAAALHESAGRKQAAWALRTEAHRLTQGQTASPGAPKGSHVFGRVWGAMGRLLDAQATAEAAARAAGRDRLARALRADHDRLARCVGVAPLERAEAAEPMPRAREPRHADCHPYRGLLEEDLEESRWSPLDSEVRGLWHLASPTELVLGRARPASGATTTGDGRVRASIVHRVFVWSPGHHTGTYTVRTRVQFLSAYCSARLVIGGTRRDRGLEISLSGGDLQYAWGDTDKIRPLSNVFVRTNDLRAYDQKISYAGRRITFPVPRESFEVVVHVSGPYVRVLVEGQEAGSLRRVTDTAIEGRVGFGVESGIARLIEPEVRRHRVLGAYDEGVCAHFDAPLRLDTAPTHDLAGLVGRRVEGIPVSPLGTALLLYAGTQQEGGGRSRDVIRVLGDVRGGLERRGIPATIRVGLPAAPGEDSLTPADGWPEADTLGLPDEHVFAHAWDAPLAARVEALLATLPADVNARTAQRIRDRPLVLILDDRNVVRSLGRLEGLARHLAGW